MQCYCGTRHIDAVAVIGHFTDNGLDIDISNCADGVEIVTRIKVDTPVCRQIDGTANAAGQVAERVNCAIGCDHIDRWRSGTQPCNRCSDGIDGNIACVTEQINYPTCNNTNFIRGRELTTNITHGMNAQTTRCNQCAGFKSICRNADTGLNRVAVGRNRPVIVAVNSRGERH